MFPGNKRKAVTFSFDDGVTQDRRLIKLFDKYGFKCTWNLNSLSFDFLGKVEYKGRTAAHDKVSIYEVKSLYAGHEVAVHTLYHPDLCKESDDSIRINIEADRIILEKLVGYPIIGMAYPFGTVDDRVSLIIKENTPIKYSRTVWATYNFDRQDDLLKFRPTVHCLDFDNLSSLVDKFIELKPDKDQILYIWGHAYEFDFDDTWDKFEQIISKLANRDDIFYGTNKEVLIDSLEK